MKKNIFKIIIFCYLLMFFASYANASTISFVAPNDSLGVGDEFLLPLMLDAGNNDLNAISGDIIFSDDTLAITNIITANSAVTLWVEQPKISGNSVVFSGVMPGGYKNVIDPVTKGNNPGILFILSVKVVGSGTGKIFFNEVHSYINDGKATETETTTIPFVIDLAKFGNKLNINLDDHNSPLAFIPIITSSPDVYGGKNVVVFSTTDKETGIDHYEVSEGNNDWVRAESPYLLSDQSLYSLVRVKAVDQAGNYRIGSVGKNSSIAIFIILIPFIILTLLLLIFHHRYKRFLKDLRKNSGN